MRTPPLPADFIYTRICKPFCAKFLTLPFPSIWTEIEYILFLTKLLDRLCIVSCGGLQKLDFMFYTERISPWILSLFC